MAKPILSLLVIVLLFACGGGLATRDGVAEASLSGMEDFVSILEGIDSKASADAAAPKLEKLALRMAEVEAARQKLGELDQDASAELEKKYKDRMMEIMQRMGQAGQTAGPYMAESEKCQQAFQRVGETMQGM